MFNLKTKEKEKKDKKEIFSKFMDLLLGFLCILGLLYIFFINVLTYKQNEEYKEEIEKLKQENEEFGGVINELENLCELQEEQIEATQSELDRCLFENLKEVEEILTYIEPLKDIDKKQYFIQYKKVMDDYEYTNKPKSIYEVYTNEQINIMCRCIETETFGAHFDGKVNVASVILNRVNHSKFPSDPISVVKAPNQFAYGRTKISEDTKLALEYAFMIGDTTDGCIAFRSDISPSNWGKWKYKFTDKIGHSFYSIE